MQEAILHLSIFSKYIIYLITGLSTIIYINLTEPMWNGIYEGASEMRGHMVLKMKFLDTLGLTSHLQLLFRASLKFFYQVYIQSQTYPLYSSDVVFFQVSMGDLCCLDFCVIILKQQVLVSLKELDDCSFKHCLDVYSAGSSS